ncbi:MAG TPA: M13 family metallopeptidase [Gemmatimonadales bacterium]|nr:M13 family metallopeptidase [Gemmatimonadales bacterium]
MARLFRTTALLVFASAAGSLHAQTRSPLPEVTAPLQVIDTAYMNRHANACVDFFDFANGGWIAKDAIPAAYSSSGVARDMSDRNELAVRSVLEDAMAKRNKSAAGSTARKLGTYYATCMDSTAAEAAGITPIKPWLLAIDSIQSAKQLLPAIAALQKNGANVAFFYSADGDLHDAAHYIADLNQGGLGLPDRDYYTDSGSAADSTRQAFVAHITKLFTLAGENSAQAESDAGEVLALETEMAKASLTRVALRDPAATDHSTTAEQLAALTPGLDWPGYFRAIGISTPVRRLNLAEPAYFQRLSRLMDSVPAFVWRAYLRYHAIGSVASWLSTPFVQENFAFSSRFTGARALLPRWKRCLRETDGDLGEALGQAYVAKTFSPDARRRAKAVIDDIRAAFRERLLHLTWMSDSTRAEALKKLSLMGEKVGYPEKWRDYSRLDVREGAFALNVARANLFEWNRTVNRPGAPVDTTEWGITVPTVNAYYDGSKNEMVFPAGALTPQTFDAGADDGANYGSLGGSWAGHELTHGFDDEGRHYDEHGNLRDWWQPADSATFTKEADKIVAQFSGYLQVDTIHGNGKLTEGENIADLGGILTGYDALERALQRDGRPGLIEGFTPEQRYFIAYAQSWRTHTRDATLRTWVKTNPHAPDYWRANGPLSNDPEFAKAFGCKAGDPMVRAPELVPHIW